MVSKIEAQVKIIQRHLTNLVNDLSEIDLIYAEMPPQARAEIELKPNSLNDLPWRPYKEGHRAAWIFADEKAAEKLLEVITGAKDGTVTIGEFTYRLSHGENRSFISRNPKT